MKTEITYIWNALGRLSWLDVGNGWRNLFLLSCLVQAMALGTLFALHRLFSRNSRVASFLAGVAVTPLMQFLWMLLLAMVWPRAPRLVYIGVLPLLGVGYMVGILLRSRRKFVTGLKRGLVYFRGVMRFDKPALVALCFALAMVMLLLPACVRLCGSMNAANPGDSGEYLALALRYCKDKDMGNLLEKEETEGHFRGHSHFPSLELYMAYGLMHTDGEVGYPNDKPALFGIGMLFFYMTAAFAALLLTLCRERKRWILLGALLFNLVPGLFYGAPRDVWRMLALLVAMLYFSGLSPAGSRKSYLMKWVVTLVLCFTVMSAHVVSFVVLPFIVVAWVVARWYGSLTENSGRAGRELLGSMGLALGGAVGTLAGFSGNLWCYWRWGNMSPFRVMTQYITAPWYSAYMEMEYKLEETTRHLDFWTAKYDILMAYASPVGLWGLRLALVALVAGMVYLFCCRRSKVRLITSRGVLTREKTKGTVQTVQMLVYAALLTLCTLAPMTGLLDSPLYSFSGSFLKLQRYTLQWFLLAAVMICAALAAMEHSWSIFCRWSRARWLRVSNMVEKFPWLRAGLRCAPALVCALLCLLAFQKGVDQTGYSNSFYRYSRNVMEDEAIALDHGFLQRYALLMTAVEYVSPEEKIILTRTGYQYPIGARGYILTANPIVPLMNLCLEQLPAALKKEGVAMVVTEKDFWDQRYYALSTLSEYLSALPSEQILEHGEMRLYLLNGETARKVSNAWEKAVAAVGP